KEVEGGIRAAGNDRRIGEGYHEAAGPALLKRCTIRTVGCDRRPRPEIMAHARKRPVRKEGRVHRLGAVARLLRQEHPVFRPVSIGREIPDLLTDLHQTITRLYVVLVWLEVASCRV